MTYVRNESLLMRPHERFCAPCSGCCSFDNSKPECSSYNKMRGFKVIAKTGIGTIREGRDDINILAMI